MAILTVIAGLPGSGKSTLVDEMKKENGLDLAEPDYMANAVSGTNALTSSKHHANLLSALSRNKDCVIADIQFVTLEKQKEIESLIIEPTLNNTTINWIMFADDWKQCVLNVLRRAE